MMNFYPRTAYLKGFHGDLCSIPGGGGGGYSHFLCIRTAGCRKNIPYFSHSILSGPLLHSTVRLTTNPVQDLVPAIYIWQIFGQENN